mmetsp:Transcript_12573/g.25643  ORF Transcript_12573/g.25643 Transcript_12573/m.25643 type:complete len:215 (-) Transcript_12573:913-1557(-)
MASQGEITVITGGLGGTVVEAVKSKFRGLLGEGEGLLLLSFSSSSAPSSSSSSSSLSSSSSSKPSIISNLSKSSSAPSSLGSRTSPLSCLSPISSFLDVRETLYVEVRKYLDAGVVSSPLCCRGRKSHDLMVPSDLFITCSSTPPSSSTAPSTPTCVLSSGTTPAQTTSSAHAHLHVAPALVSSMFKFIRQSPQPISIERPASNVRQHGMEPRS